MEESDRYEMSDVHKVFHQATELWQKSVPFLGTFTCSNVTTDGKVVCFTMGSIKIIVSTPYLRAISRFGACMVISYLLNLTLVRGLRMRLATIRCFTKAMKYGNKFIYQTVPRLLTIWLDMGEDPAVRSDENFTKITAEISRAISGVPAFKVSSGTNNHHFYLNFTQWYTAFPQIASRVGHDYPPVFEVLARLISTVIKEFPQQTLWLFASVVKSRNKNRASRGRTILEKLQVRVLDMLSFRRAYLRQSSCVKELTHVSSLINASIAMVNGLLSLCNFTAPEPSRIDGRTTLSMKRDIPHLAKLMPSPLIVPLQELLTATLPPTSSTINSHHQPFPSNPPTFDRNIFSLDLITGCLKTNLADIADEIEVMKSLAKPRKVTIHGSDGQTYAFLGKPKDDLRKDARLMDFNSIINKILNMNSDSRRRQLRTPYVPHVMMR